MSPGRVGDCRDPIGLQDARVSKACCRGVGLALGVSEACKEILISLFSCLWSDSVRCPVHVKLAILSQRIVALRQVIKESAAQHDLFPEAVEWFCFLKNTLGCNRIKYLHFEQTR